MISESPFAAIFGAPVPGGADSLVHLARYAVRSGYAVVPCLPGTKKPLCTLPAVAARKADQEAQEAARLAGRRQWQLVRHTCGVHHAITDEKESDRVIKRLVRDYGPINLGVELGRSRVIVVDVDTDAEKAGFEASWAEATGSPLPFPMTVASPGVQDGPGGAWLHKNGGHYWFTLPAGFDLPASDGAMKDDSGWIAMWANRQVLVPPSVRAEGPYVLVGDVHPAPPWLLLRIVEHLDVRMQRATAQEARRQERVEGDAEAHIDAWSSATEWRDLLEPDGWYATTLPDNCGCEIWTSPGVHASPKSATAHDVGCALYDDSPGHAPLHVWTDNPPDFLIDVNKTVTKIQYVAYRDHGGNIEQACRAEGIAREGGVDLVGVGEHIPAHLGGPLAPMVNPFTAPAAAPQVEPDPSGDPVYYDTTGTGWVVEPGQTDEELAEQGFYPTWNEAKAAAQRAGDEHYFEGPGADETAEYAAGTLVGLSLPSPSTPGQEPFPPLPLPPGAPPVVTPDDPFERAVRLKLVDRLVAAEADRQYLERRYPFAAKVGQRGFEPMRDVVKAALETPAAFLVERILRKGSYGVLGAEYKAGKTFLALDMGLSIATGSKFLGLIPCEPGRVALMHNEGDKVEFVERLRAVASAKGITLTDTVLDQLMFQEGASKLDQPDAVNKLHSDLSEFSPDLLIIDPWYMSAGDDADGKTLSKMGTVLGNLQGVAADLGSALLITAHWNKSGDGKGVTRWSGSGLAEWGRVLINVAVDKVMPSQPYAEDVTGRTTVDLSIGLSGQVSGNYWVHREVWRDDAADLTTPMRYTVTAREQEDMESDGAGAAARDTTRTPRERILHTFGAHPEGMTKSKAIETAKGPKGGRTFKVWTEAFDELVREDYLIEVGIVTVTNADGQIKATPGVKYGISPAGTAEMQRMDDVRKNAGADTRKFTQPALTGLATTEENND